MSVKSKNKKVAERMKQRSKIRNTPRLLFSESQVLAIGNLLHCGMQFYDSTGAFANGRVTDEIENVLRTATDRD